MSFVVSALIADRHVVRYGDTVFIYVGHKSIFAQEVTPGSVFQSRFGALRHDELVGRPYGSRFQCSKGHVFVLRATPELWTECLPHRTQILYFADIALVTSALDLRPGSLVLESGTGSGSLTHSLARTVHPHGHVHTFDFHETRVQQAREELQRHGLAPRLVTCCCRDVSTAGFPEELKGRADAVFLDLPHPWLCIAFAHATLRSGGRVASFSPCVQQVQRTQQALRQHSFHTITTFECLLRPTSTVRTLSLKSLDNSTPAPEYTVCFPSTTQAGHTGFLTFASRR